MLRSILLLSLALPLAACEVPEETVDHSCTPADVAVDTLEATVDGDAWDADFGGGSVTNAGGVNLTFVVDANNTMSLRLKASATFLDADNFEEGDELVVDNDLAFGADDLPLEVALGEASDEGGDVTLVLDATSFNSAHGDGGYLKLTSLDGGVLRGCMRFNAETQAGDASTDFADGSFAATLP